MACDRMIGPYPCCSVVQGDCLELMKSIGDEDGKVWSFIEDEPKLAKIAVVTDPPYGIGWSRGENKARNSKPHSGIANDHDTSARDEMLAAITCPAIVFGSFYAPYPANVKQVLVWHKPSDAGVVGSTTGFRRDCEPVFIVGNWPIRTVEFSSVLRSCRGGIASIVTETGHPHTKPLDLMEALVEWAEADTILDPFCGSGTTLVAAKKLGRHYLGMEISEDYCKIARDRLARIEAQPTLFAAQAEQLTLGSEG